MDMVAVSVHTPVQHVVSVGSAWLFSLWLARKRILATGALLAVFGVADAQQYWLQPDRYFLKSGERLRVKFFEGENFLGKPWDLSERKIIALDAIENTQIRHLVDSIDEQTGMLTTRFTTAGTSLVTMTSGPTLIVHPAEAFNAYLIEDGLDDIYAQRRKSSKPAAEERESTSLFIKLYLQVGEALNDTYATPIGTPLELVPQENPYRLKPMDKCKFLVLYNGEPLFAAKVRIWNRFDNRTTIQNVWTQKDGMIEMHISNPGPWMLSVVKMLPSREEDAQWRSYRSSVIFGVRR